MVKSKFKEIFYHMLQTRFLEEALIEEHKKGKTHGALHLCIGQEAVGAAACASLEPGDVISTGVRSHTFFIAKGIDLKKFCCQIFGRQGGYDKGRVGHVVFFDLQLGITGGATIVGGNIPIAVGEALAFQLRKEKRIAVSIFGDGASNTGSFHESLNMAAKWRLPVVFLCENNQYGLTTHVDVVLSVKDISVRAEAYNIPGVSVFGNDFEKVYDVMVEATGRARSGEGPTLIEAKTYRIHGFSTGDRRGYQKEEEMNFWKDKDPIIIGENLLIGKGECTKDEIEEMKRKALEDVKEAVEYAINSPYPEGLDLPRDLFKGEVQ